MAFYLQWQNKILSNTNERNLCYGNEPVSFLLSYWALILLWNFAPKPLARNVRQCFEGVLALKCTSYWPFPSKRKHISWMERRLFKRKTLNNQLPLLSWHLCNRRHRDGERCVNDHMDWHLCICSISDCLTCLPLHKKISFLLPLVQISLWSTENWCGIITKMQRFKFVKIEILMYTKITTENMSSSHQHKNQFCVYEILKLCETQLWSHSLKCLRLIYK